MGFPISRFCRPYVIQWQLRYLYPLYKGKGTKTDPNNFEGIALTSGVAKVQAGMITNGMYKWVLTRKILRHSQHGFFAVTDQS